MQRASGGWAALERTRRPTEESLEKRVRRTYDGKVANRQWKTGGQQLASLNTLHSLAGLAAEKWPAALKVTASGV
mgnify:CR=1 FL=1